MTRLLLLLSLVLVLAGCTTATRVEDPAEILGFRAKSPYTLRIDGKGSAQDECVALALLRAENARLKKDLEDCEEPEPAPPEPVKAVRFRRPDPGVRRSWLAGAALAGCAAGRDSSPSDAAQRAGTATSTARQILYESEPEELDGPSPRGSRPSRS